MKRSGLPSIAFGAVFLLVLSVAGGVQGKSPGGGFAGVEYLNSDAQTSKAEVEKLLGLRPGASYDSAERALAKLQSRLEERRLHANLDIVEGDADEFYVSVDILRAGVSGEAPTRKLKFPHAVYLSSNRPLAILGQLEARRAKLQEEGRSTEVVYRGGVKHYQDTACDQMVDQLMVVTPPVRSEVFQMIASDPDPKRRMSGLELLNWAGQPVRDVVHAVPAINDVDPDVRVLAAKYVLARFDALPDKFPWTELIEAYSFQLTRPSHRDRSTALFCLTALAKQRPQVLYGVKVYSEEKLKQLAEQTTIPAMRSRSEALLAQLAKVKAPPKVTPGETGF